MAITAEITPAAALEVVAEIALAKDAYMLAMDGMLAAGTAQEDLPTRAAWLASLEGEPGPPGTTGWAGIANKPAFGSAATQDAGAFATADQGGKADTALQDAGAFATAEQGGKADTALQELPTSFTAPMASNLVGDAGIGALPYMAGKDSTILLPPNTASSKQFLSQTGTGAAGAAPAWVNLAISDVSGAVGGWTRRTESSFAAVKGGRYIIDVSGGSITVGDISNPQDGDSYEFIVYGATTNYMAIVGTFTREESALPIVRRYKTATYSWHESLAQIPWEKKSGNFTPVKGGRYKITSSLTIAEGSTTGFMADDIYEFIIVNSAATVTIGTSTFTQASTSYIRRCSYGSTFESLPTLIGAYIYKTGTFTAEAGKDYLVVGSYVSVSDPSGSTGQSYTVVVAGSGSSAIIGGTTCYESCLPVVRRNTGSYVNGSYWVTVPFNVPTAYYYNGSQSSTFYPSLSNGLNHSVTPSSSGSWYLGAPMSGASDGKVLRVVVTGYWSGGNSIYFMSMYSVDSGGVGYISTPITLAANKKYYFEFTYLSSSWILTNHRGPF